MFVLGTSCHATNLKGAISKAVEHSASLKSQLYQYRSLKKKYKASMLASFLPEARVTYSVSKNFRDLDYNHSTQKGRFVMTQKLINGGSAGLGRSSYLVKAEKIALQRSKQKIALTAVKTYVDVLRSTEMLKLREHKEHIALENLSAMRKRFSLNEVTDTEVSLAKAKFSSFVSERVDAEGKLALAKIAYYHLVGEEADNLAEINDFLLPDVSGLNEYLQLAKNNNLSLKEIIYKRKAERKGVDFAQSKFLPSLEVHLSSGFPDEQKTNQVRMGDLFKDAKIGFTVTVPIFNGWADTVGIGAAKMGLKKLTYDYYEEVKDVEQKVIRAWNTMLTAQAMIKASLEAEQAATLALAGVAKEVELNLKSTTDLLDAEDALFKARSDFVEAKSNYVINIYDLLFITNSIDIV